MWPMDHSYFSLGLSGDHGCVRSKRSSRVNPSVNPFGSSFVNSNTHRNCGFGRGLSLTDQGTLWVARFVGCPNAKTPPDEAGPQGQPVYRLLATARTRGTASTTCRARIRANGGPARSGRAAAAASVTAAIRVALGWHGLGVAMGEGCREKNEGGGGN